MLHSAYNTSLYSELLADDPVYYVPEVIPELTTKRILATELIHGIPLDKVRDMDQETRNRVSVLFIYFVYWPKYPIISSFVSSNGY